MQKKFDHKPGKILNEDYSIIYNYIMDKRQSIRDLLSSGTIWQVDNPLLLEACKSNGIEPEDLLYHSKDFYRNNPDNCKYWIMEYEYNEKKRLERIEIVKKTYNSLVLRRERKRRASPQIINIESVPQRINEENKRDPVIKLKVNKEMIKEMTMKEKIEYHKYKTEKDQQRLNEFFKDRIQRLKQKSLSQKEDRKRREEVANKITEEEKQKEEEQKKINNELKEDRKRKRDEETKRKAEIQKCKKFLLQKNKDYNINRMKKIEEYNKQKIMTKIKQGEERAMDILRNKQSHEMFGDQLNRTTKIWRPDREFSPYRVTSKGSARHRTPLK